MTQAARNLVLDLEDSRLPGTVPDPRPRWQVPDLFDAVLPVCGIWVQTCRRELLDRTLIWNQRHLLHALREFEAFYNEHRPHQGIANARPLKPLPPPITEPDEIAHLNIRKQPQEAEHAQDRKSASRPSR